MGKRQAGDLGEIMKRQFNIEEMFKRNPHLDRSKSEEITRMTKELRRRGLKKRGYRLRTPMTWTNLLIPDYDPCAVQLRER